MSEWINTRLTKRLTKLDARLAKAEYIRLTKCLNGWMLRFLGVVSCLAFDDKSAAGSGRRRVYRCSSRFRLTHKTRVSRQDGRTFFCAD